MRIQKACYHFNWFVKVWLGWKKRILYVSKKCSHTRLDAPFTSFLMQKSGKVHVKLHLSHYSAIPKRHKITSTDFYFNCPSWWNDLPNSIQTESLAIFKKRLKTHLFIYTWPFNTSNSLFNFYYIYFSIKYQNWTLTLALYSVSILSTCFFI